MAESPARTKPAVTRRQVVVIAVLGVVLAVVLIAQFGGASGRPTPSEPGKPQPKADVPKGSTAEPQAGAAVPRRGESQPKAAASQSNPLRAPGVASPPQPAAPPKESPAWPKFKAEAAAQYDPFVMPEPLAKQTQAEQSEKAKAAKPPRRTLPRTRCWPRCGARGPMPCSATARGRQP